MTEDDENPGSVDLGSEDGACVSNGECCDMADLESVELRKEEHGSRQGETCRQRVVDGYFEPKYVMNLRLMI